MESLMAMPKFAILVTHNEFLWWSYMLVIDHKPVVNEEKYATALAAFNAALNDANRRGLYNP